MDEHRIVLSDTQLDALAARAAKLSVREVFALLGVDVARPESVEEFREDLRFGKRLRKAADRGMFAFAAVGGGAMIYAMWDGIVQAIKRAMS